LALCGFGPVSLELMQIARNASTRFDGQLAIGNRSPHPTFLANVETVLDTQFLLDSAENMRFRCPNDPGYTNPTVHNQQLRFDLPFGVAMDF